MTKLLIALVQQDTVWHDPVANRKKMQEAVRDAADAGARVVALTEMFATGFTMSSEQFAELLPGGPTSDAVRDAAIEAGVFVIGTVIERHSPRPRNAAYVVSPTGDLVAVYQKIHPFSYGEENKHYVGGDDLPIFEIDGVKAGLQICYDLRFPEPFRALSRAGAQVVFVPANWPVRRAMHWTTLLAARAIENQMVVCGINRVGKDPNVEYPGLSAIHDARGEVLARGDNREALVSAEVDFGEVEAWREQFPALKIDAPPCTSNSETDRGPVIARRTRIDHPPSPMKRGLPWLTTALAVLAVIVPRGALATPDPLPPGLEGRVDALTSGDLSGGCEVSSARIESFSIELQLKCGADTGTLRLVPRDVGSSEHPLAVSPSFSMEASSGSTAIQSATRQLADRIAARDDGKFLQEADALRGRRASSRGDHRQLIEAIHLGILDSLRRAAVWITMLALLLWLLVQFARQDLQSTLGRVWLVSLAALFAAAAVVRFTVPPWAPLHANIHGIAELRGLVSAPSSWHGPVESDRYGPAYRQIVHTLISLWHGGARSALGVAAMASALAVVPLAILTAALTGSRLAGAVSAFGLAIHPIHVALAGSESPMALAGTLFLTGLACLCSVIPAMDATRRRALYWAGALAVAACAELGIATLALAAAALIVAFLARGRFPLADLRLWRTPLAVLVALVGLHLFSLSPVIRDALRSRGGDMLATFQSFQGTRNALFDSTLTAVTLVPLAVAGLVALLIRERRAGIGLALASVLLLAMSAFVIGCRSDVIRYQTDAHLLLFVLAASSVLLVPAVPQLRAAAAALVVGLLVVPTRAGLAAVHQPLVDAAAFQLIEQAATRVPSKIFIATPPRRMGNNEVLSDFPDFLLEADGRSVGIDETPPASIDGCYVWLGPPCYSFSLTESLAHVQDKAKRVGEWPLRQECEDLVSRIDASRPPLIDKIVSVPFQSEEFHHVPDHMLVGLFPCAAPRPGSTAQAAGSNARSP